MSMGVVVVLILGALAWWLLPRPDPTAPLREAMEDLRTLRSWSHQQVEDAQALAANRQTEFLTAVGNDGRWLDHPDVQQFSNYRHQLRAEWHRRCALLTLRYPLEESTPLVAPEPAEERMN